MPQTLEAPVSESSPTPAVTPGTVGSAGIPGSAGDIIRGKTTAIRLSFEWLGTQRKFEDSQRKQTADGFSAQADAISATRKLYNTKSIAFKKVNSVKSRIEDYFHGCTYPYPVPGIRLIHSQQLQQGPNGESSPWQLKMAEFQRDLTEAVNELQSQYDQVIEDSRTRLGDLFDVTLYPSSFLDQFSFTWDTVNLEISYDMKKLNPELYAAEQEKVKSRFDAAYSMTEQMLTEEFAKVVEHMTDKLSGEKKTFRDTLVTNVTDFFEHFKLLNVTNSSQLDELVSRAKEAVKGITPQQLRDSGNLRQKVMAQMTAVQAQLDGMMVDKPKRRVLLRNKAETPAGDDTAGE
jgi:hypothetical protein